MGAGWQFCWGSNRWTGGGGGGGRGAWEPAQADPSKLPITLHTGPCIYYYVMCNTLQATANKNKNL